MRPGPLLLAAALLTAPLCREARADEPRRSLVHAGLGAGAIVPVLAGPSYQPGWHVSGWAGISLGNHVVLRPTYHLYTAGSSYGMSSGVRSDLLLAVEYVLPFGDRFEFLPGLIGGVAFPSPASLSFRAVGLGLTFSLNAFFADAGGLYFRTTHRMVVTIEDGALMNTFELGPIFRFW